MARRVRANSTVLSMAIAQTHTEQNKSPIMTDLTIQWACQNSVKSERSDDVSGSTDCATSAGFMGTSFSLSGFAGQNRRGAQLRTKGRAGQHRSRVAQTPFAKTYEPATRR